MKISIHRASTTQGSRKNRATPGRILCPVVLALFLASPVVRAVDYTWINPVSGAWTSSSNWSPTGTPAFNSVAYINNGGTAVIGAGTQGPNGSIVLGLNTGESGNLVVRDGGYAHSYLGSISIGVAGNGSLSILNGGSVWKEDTAIGSVFSGQTGVGTATVSGAGSLFTYRNSLRIGEYGTGTLNILNGGAVKADTSTSSSISMGGGNTGTGTVLVSGAGSTLTYGSFYLYHGDLSIVDGGTVDGYRAEVYGNPYGGSATATVNGANSLWKTATLLIGGNGPSSVNLENGGTLTIDSGNGFVEMTGNSFLNIGTGGAAGILNAAEINSGPGTVNFNHTGTVNFSTAMNGNLSVNKLAAGTTVLTGTSTYTGPTSVNAGKLLVNGSLGATAVTVASGALLGGTGTIDGTVAIQNGGILSPGDAAPGTLTVGSLLLDNASVLDFQLDTPGVLGGGVNDLLTVNGDLTLDGILNVTRGANFALGTYRLADYTGFLTDNGLTIGNQALDYDFFVDTSTPLEVNLTTKLSLNYWDGPNLAANNVVDGGTGTWTNAATNWTNSAGSENGPWSTKLAVFSGTAGVVTLGDDIAVPGMRFTVDGYTINRDAAGLHSLAPTGPASILVDGGVTATINAPLTETGGLEKNGAGTLVLGGASTFTGDTAIHAGALTVVAGGSVTHSLATTYVGKGNGDDGSLALSGGALSDLNGHLGFEAGAKGTATITGGSWTLASDLNVGQSGTGVLAQSAGTIAAVNGTIGNLAGSHGTATLTGGSWSNSYQFQVGSRGTGVLTLDGGTVTDQYGYIGGIVGGAGTANVSSGSWTSSLDLTVGYAGTGVLNVSGGVVRANQNVYTGHEATGDGTINLSGIAALRGVLETGSVIRRDGAGKINFNGGILRALRNEANFLSGYQAGDVKIQNEGAYIDTNGFNIGISTVLSGAGPLIKQGAGNLTLTGANTYTGNAAAIPRGTTVNAGTLTLGQGGSITHANADIVVGEKTGDNAAMVFSGGTVSNWLGVIGAVLGSNGTVTVTSGTWTNSSLVVGRGGTGSLILNGGSVSNHTGFIGTELGSIGAVTVTSGTWNNTGNLQVGNHDKGSLTINGGTVFSRDAIVGVFPGGIGEVTVTTGAWSNSRYLAVGLESSGALAINGGSVSALEALIGSAPGSVGTATVTGGSWTNSTALSIGLGGTGTLNITGGTVSAPTVYTGQGGSGIAAINLSGAGVLAAGQIVEGLGTSTINLNGGILRSLGNQGNFLSGYEVGDVTIQSGGAFIDTNGFDIGIGASLGGPGALTKQGAGALTLAGENTFTGGTTINVGTLAVSGGAALADTGAVTLANTAGATFNLLNNETIGSLAGGGNLGGNVTLNANTLTTGAANTNTTYFGIISGNGALTKTGAGTLTLTGENTYTGATTVNAGILRLDFSGAGAPANHIVKNTSPLALNGGTLEIVGENNEINRQDFGGLSVGSGASRVVLDQITNDARLLLVNLGNVNQRMIGGTVDFTPGIAPRSLLTMTNTPDGGVLFGWATVNNGSTWATFQGGNLKGFAAYDTTWAAGNNTDVLSDLNPVAGSTTNTVRFNDAAAARTVTLQGTNTITAGGILVTANVGNNLSKITGGAITSDNTEKDLIIHQYNTAAALEIASDIVNNGVMATGLTKSGLGTLILSGNNTYTGRTTINEGKLVSDGTFSGSAVVRNGATLAGNGTFGNITVEHGGILSPGHSPGNLTGGSGTWGANGSYYWEMNDATGAAGVEASGWDVQTFYTTLEITATEGSPYILDIHSLTLANLAGAAANFDPLQSYSWTIATANGGITGFDASFFTIDTSNFSNPFDGNFSLALDVGGNNLNLLYSSVPEPGIHMLFFSGLVIGWASFVRKRPASAN